MGNDDKDIQRYYSSSLTPLQVELFKSLPTKLKSLIRLVKYWRKQNAGVLWAASWQNDCAPSEDSGQPGHPPNLIRVFAVRMKKLGSIATVWAHSEDSGHPPSLIWVFAGRTCHFVGFVLLRLIIYIFFFKLLCSTPECSTCSFSYATLFFSFRI